MRTAVEALMNMVECITAALKNVFQGVLAGVRCKAELMIARLSAPAASRVPTRLAALNPLRELAKAAR